MTVVFGNIEDAFCKRSLVTVVSPKFTACRDWQLSIVTTESNVQIHLNSSCSHRDHYFPDNTVVSDHVDFEFD